MTTYQAFGENTAMESKKYDAIDGIFAIFVVAVMLMGYVLLADYFLTHNQNLGMPADEGTVLSQLIMSSGFLILIFLYMLARKQKISSLGLTKINLKASFLFGLLFSFLYVMMFLTIHWIKKDLIIEDVLPVILPKMILNLLTWSFFEEILFRGFIGPRMRGLVQNAFLSSVLVSLMFTFMHFPFNAIGFNGSLLNYFTTFGMYHLILFVLHLVFQFFYDKYENIAAPTLLHFIYNFCATLFRSA